MDLTRLQVLVAVARTGSVTAAAEELHYAQPSISHHLARLEAEVGVPLVQRAGRGIRLTDAGTVLVSRAEEILGRVAATRDEIAAFAGLRAGRVRLAAFPSALATLVPPAAARFGERHPDLGLGLTESEPPESITALRSGDIDVALLFAHADSDPPPNDITVTALFDEPLYLVTAADNDPNSRHDGLRGYANARWIAGCERCRAHLLKSCQAAGFVPSIAFETDDYVAAQALVAAGLGVTTLPGLALLAHRNTDVRVDQLPGEFRRVVAATYGKPPAPLPVQALLTALTDTAIRPGFPD
ncbi:LysR family transcriptional regulator [Haloechinothrix salitolerans]|uniref:LysR family transcriptional regulator n=1 Tax=Haloechinothrix salitolerans TaxID=926830 RepID=A0ABW2BZI0_9PSEU